MIEKNLTILHDLLNEIVYESRIINSKKEKLMEQKKQLILRSDNEYKQKLQSVEEKIRIVKSLQGMSLGFPIDRQHKITAIEYDKTVLSGLAIKEKSIENAQQLYDTAGGMLIWLEYEKTNVQNSAESNFKKNEYQLSELSREISEKQEHLQKLYDSLKADDSVFHLLTKELDESKIKFSGNRDSVTRISAPSEIALGTIDYPIPVIPGNYIADTSHISLSTGTAKIPFTVDWNKTGVIVAEYSSFSESEIFSGIVNLIINSVLYSNKHYDEIIVFDTVRFNSHAMAPLDEYIGKDTIISDVPSSPEKTKLKISALIDKFQNPKKIDVIDENKLLVFHNFPDGYEHSSVEEIYRLCANARNYNLNIVVSVKQGTSSLHRDEINRLIDANTIVIQGDGNIVHGNLALNGFVWFPSPKTISTVIQAALAAQAKAEESYNYNQVVGFTKELKKGQKGIRKIENIPYGKDDEGNIRYLSFEGNNFATFIAGASRSGKSTLLHTIISGVIKNMHPDDVEIWLVDFKMTEFSRYTNHLPPHVRYIVLDESPELVYNIVNRLYEILVKRQNIFKGRWEKIDDVPPERYMPAILVIVDEFSVMSQIIADSVLKADDNYQYKLQLLLVKGAAVGMHFIFASQGFTNGTRGLTDLAKGQIQQRITMKTSYSEIRQTLDLKETSNPDIKMMEELTPHHTLVRVPVTDAGNHLLHAKVLYIEDADQQLGMIDGMETMFIPSEKFQPDDETKYIFKRPVVVDGNKYNTFDERLSEYRKWLKDNRAALADADEKALLIGAAQKLQTIVPVRLSNSFRENVIIFAPPSERDSSASVLLSLMESLRKNHTGTAILASKNNRLQKRLQEVTMAEMTVGLESVCDQIHAIRKRIEKKQVLDEAYILLGFDILIQDMAFLDTGNVGSFNSTFSKRKPGELDLMTRLELLKKGVQDEAISDEAPVQMQQEERQEEKYDAQDDLKYVLTNGPRFGCHFILVLQSPGDIEQLRIDTQLFKHKVCFRYGKRELSSIIGASAAETVSELPDRIFYYTDGVSGLTFRPLLHQGLSWDGWTVSFEGEAIAVDDEDEYLL